MAWAGLMTDDELEDALHGLAIHGLDEKSAELVAIAHERGAPDNVTLGFLAVEDDALGHPRTCAGKVPCFYRLSIGSPASAATSRMRAARLGLSAMISMSLVRTPCRSAADRSPATPAAS